MNTFWPALGCDAGAQGKAAVLVGELRGGRELRAIVGIHRLLLEQEAVIGRDHGLAALEAADLAQDRVQLLEGPLHRLAGVGFGVALVADPIDAVVIHHDQVVLLDEFRPFLGGGQVEEVFRLDRPGAAYVAATAPVPMDCLSARGGRSTAPITLW